MPNKLNVFLELPKWSILATLSRVTTDLQKIKAIQNWPTPKTLKQLHGFLGLSGYYHRFIKHYGQIAKPLTNLLKKEVFGWSTETQETFDTLKQRLCLTPVLALSDSSVSFTLDTDASSRGIGVVLMQKSHPIAYISRMLSPKIQFLSMYEREMLAILFTL